MDLVIKLCLVRFCFIIFEFLNNFHCLGNETTSSNDEYFKINQTF